MDETVRIGLLKRLARLHDIGDLSEEEFAAEKERLNTLDGHAEEAEIAEDSLFDDAELQEAPNPALFVGLYLLLIVPTYIIPLFGSTSVVFAAALSNATDEWGWLQIASVAFALHAACLALLATLTFWHGRRTGHNWIVVFPVIAAAFDLIPGLNFVPLVPTFMHLAAIIVGAIVSNHRAFASSGNQNASMSRGLGCVLVAIALVATLVVSSWISGLGYYDTVEIPLNFLGLIIETKAIYAWFLAPFALGLYLLPVAIAYLRHARDVLFIALLCLFAGWTIIGWGIAMAWAIFDASGRSHERYSW